MAPERQAPGYHVYKGLQQPLVFRNLKGRYIYWGLASVFGGFLSAVTLTVAVNFLVGFVGMLAVTMAGLLFTNSRQKKGLYAKTRSAGVHIIPARLARRR